MQKIRASADVVSVVLIIAMAVATITILAVSLKNINLQTSPEFSCLDIQKDSLITIEKTCYNSKTEEIEIILRRKFDEFLINYLDFSFANSSYSCDCKECVILEPGTSKKYFISEEKQIMIVSANDCEIARVSVADC